MLATIVLVLDVPDVTIADSTKLVEELTTDQVSSQFPGAKFASVKVGVTAQAIAAGFEPTALGDWLVYVFSDELDKTRAKFGQRRLVGSADTREAATKLARELGASQIQSADGTTTVWLPGGP